MPIRYTISKKARTAYFEGTGRVTGTEILADGAKAFSDPRWVNGYNVICDYRAVTNFDVSTAEIRQVAAQDQHNERVLDKSRCGIVAASDFVYGMTRMWQLVSAETKVEATTFREMDACLDWLKLDAATLAELQAEAKPAD